MALKSYRLLSITCLLCLALSLSVSMARAATGSELTFTPACSGFTTRGGSLVTDRDNTGRGLEAIVVSAVDGGGRVIYESESLYPVNQRIVFGDGDGINWTTLPQSNPILMQVISLAGNGQPQQFIYAVTGNCSRLPNGSGSVPTFPPVTYTAAGGAAVSAAGYDPNAVLPRPVNPAGAVDSLPGYGVVMTDNLYLRSGDSAEYTPLAILDGGVRLIMLGKNSSASWWYVEVGGLRGWVNAQFLALRGDLRAVPVVPANGTLIPPTLYVGAANAIYNTPSVNGLWLCQITGSRFYPVVARDSSAASWYRIEASCDGQPILGWIQANRGILRNPARVDIPVY